MIDVGITDLLDFEIREKLRKEMDNRKNGNIKFHPLRPSSAGHCSRKLALELMEYRGKAFYPRPIIEPNIDRLFALGHSVEYSALRMFELVSLFEQRYKQQLLTLFTIERVNNLGTELIEGSCDAVLWSKDYKCIIDVKSKKDGWSNAYSSKWDAELDSLKALPSISTISDTAIYAEDLDALIQDLKNDWLVDNLLQLNLYANSDFIKERGITFAALYRYNKNDSRHMEIRFKPSWRKFNEIREKFTEICKRVDENTVGEMLCDFPFGSIRYAFCDCHKMSPYGDQDPVKAYFKTLPKKVWAKDAAEIKGYETLKTAYETYCEGKKGETSASSAEEEIISVLTKAKISKVRFEDGAIYEVKFLKSPREHYELRRSK